MLTLESNEASLSIRISASVKANLPVEARFATVSESSARARVLPEKSSVFVLKRSAISLQKSEATSRSGPFCADIQDTTPIDRASDKLASTTNFLFIIKIPFLY